MTNQVDEETPLLPSQQIKDAPTPLPWFQFSIVLLLQLAEPLTSQVIHPFAPELIRDIGITHGNNRKVGYYVGMMQSTFFVAEALMVLHWSRISDNVGRKPVILTGLFGLSLSMYCFGLSRTFWGLLLSRSLNGALNGNIGVIKSMLMELTNTSNIARAYVYLPLTWSTGTTLGPMIGGSLSRPAERFPKLFGGNNFLKKYPYFLPCAISATYSALIWLLAFLFLKETVKRPIPILQYIGLVKEKDKKKSQNDIDNHEGACAASGRANCSSNDERPLPLRSLLVPKIILVAGNYALISLVDIAYCSIRPVFLSTPIEDGGLGLSAPQIGNVMSVIGVVNAVIQIFLFAALHDRWGSKKTFMIGVSAALPAFILYPVINFFARSQGFSALVWIVVAFQILFGVTINFAYGAIFIFISGVSPNRASLGAINGLCQVTVSIMRAIGPATANSLYSLSIDQGYLGGNLVYYVLGGSVVLVLYFSSLLPHNVQR
ncbi:hypothetical protein AMATHDRAFT_59848 [Amanita thiersii Skay4041]|uniref:Major facilitator superfamily (MFS) profile domain-containing protein n=1 Tax=Amanita thiersii Skay4041 TaxID=703135 RepID=A0A2A9NS16_9AGAR|nr:hypothetical protein AMATHDRAFT_59848 [Amanita thiersii Skay4041]